MARAARRARRVRRSRRRVAPRPALVLAACAAPPPPPAEPAPAADPGAARRCRRGGGAHRRVPLARPSRGAPRPARLGADRRPRARPTRLHPAHARAPAPDPRRAARPPRPRRDAGRGAAAARGDVLRHDGVRDRAHLRPRGAEMAALGDRVRPVPPAARRRARSGACSSGCRPSRRSRSTSAARSSARSSSRSRGSTRSCRCSTRRSSSPRAGGAHGVVIGMAHRGRLSVLAHTLGQPYEAILREFEGERAPDAVVGSPEGGTGDVKYHLGAEGDERDGGGRRSPSRSSRTRATSRPWTPSSRAGRARSRPTARPAPAGTTRPSRCRSSSTATPRSRGRASSPRRSTSRGCPATRPAARSI